jgi:hypothetical protein
MMQMLPGKINYWLWVSTHGAPMSAQDEAQRQRFKSWLEQLRSTEAKGEVAVSGADP